MTPVFMTSGDWLQAREWAAKVLDTGLEATPNYTGLAAPERFVTGYIGEIAVRKWLDWIDAAYSYRVTLNGRHNASEFLVRLPGRTAQLEVKTAAHPKALHFMMPEAQPVDADYFIGTHIVDPGCVVLWGWLAREDVEALPVRDFGHNVPTRHRPFTTLRPLQDFGMQIGKRTTVTA